MKLLNTALLSCLLLTITLNAFPQTGDSQRLPLFAFPKAGNQPLIVYLTGDGGMNEFSKGVIADLGNHGYAVVALDTRKYFWDQKSPAAFGKAAEGFISQYLKAWKKTSFRLVGYSFGADVGAFVPPQLSAATASKLEAVVLLSPGFSTGFVTKLTNMLGFAGSDSDKYKVYPQLLKSPAPVLCVFGKDEESDFFDALKAGGKINKMKVPGSHRYNDDVQLISKVITSNF
jgi:type IV secretory pathway VirJ component